MAWIRRNDSRTRTTREVRYPVPFCVMILCVFYASVELRSQTAASSFSNPVCVYAETKTYSSRRNLYEAPHRMAGGTIAAEHTYFVRAMILYIYFIFQQWQHAEEYSKGRNWSEKNETPMAAAACLWTRLVLLSSFEFSNNLRLAHNRFVLFKSREEVRGDRGWMYIQ